MDEGVVRAVREGIAAYAMESKKRTGKSNYPPVLDDAAPGNATPYNLMFSKVLEKGIAVTGWEKTDQYGYQAPNGDAYYYDPQIGSFEAREKQVGKGPDTSSGIRETDADSR